MSAKTGLFRGEKIGLDAMKLSLRSCIVTWQNLFNSAAVRWLTAIFLDLPFKSLDNQEAARGRQQVIPKIVYQTWEVNSFGRRHKKSIQTFRRLNSDLSFTLFDSKARDEYMMTEWGNRKIYEAYRCATIGALKADIFRYCILYNRGGYYFDISKGLTESITKLHRPSASSFLALESNSDPEGIAKGNELAPTNLIVQWGLGFAPQHPILANHIARIEATLNEYIDRVFPLPKEAILRFTGPIAFSQSVRECIAECRDLMELTGIDFNGHGVFSLNGSGSRYLISDSYAKFRNSKILDSSLLLS